MRGTRPGASSFLAATAVALVTLPSCSPGATEISGAGHHPPVTIPSASPAPLPGGTVQLSMPLAAYTATAQQRAFVGKARATLVDRCLARFGFSPRFVPALSDTSPEDPPVSWRYGVSDPVIAASYGYHLPPEYRLPPDSRKRYLAEAYADPPTATEKDVLGIEGGRTDSHKGQPVPAGGCVGEAERKLGKRDGANYLDDTFAQWLAFLGHEQSMKDVRVTAVIDRWSRCMEERGHRATKLAEASKEFDLSAPHATRAEIVKATTDVACKQETNLVAVCHAVEVAYQHQLIERNIQRLREGRSSVDMAVRVASETLG